MPDWYDRFRAGWRHYNPHEGVDSPSLTRIGRALALSLFDLVLAQRHSDNVGQDVETGFVGNGFLASASGLTISVAPGWGMYDRVSRDGADPAAAPWDPVYIPMQLADVATVGINAHESQERVDLIWATPVEQQTEVATRRVRQLGPGSRATQELYTKKTWSAHVGKTTGTAGAGVPAIGGTNRVLIARVTVPAVSGALLVEDMRPLLASTGHGWQTIPDTTTTSGAVPYARDIVRDGCEVTAGTGLAVNVASGTVDVGGARRTFLARPGLSLGTSNPSNPRWVLVYLDGSRTGGLRAQVVAGTAAASPVRPELPAGGVIPLAYVYLNAAATTPTSIFNEPRKRPYHSDMIEDKTPDIIASLSIAVQPVAASPFAQERRVTVQAMRLDGTPYLGQVAFLATVWGEEPDAIGPSHGDAAIPLDTVTGTLIDHNGAAVALLSTSDGVIEFEILNNSAPQVVWLKVEPMLYLDASADAPAAMTTPSYRPAGPTYAQVGHVVRS